MSHALGHKGSQHPTISQSKSAGTFVGSCDAYAILSSLLQLLDRQQQQLQHCIHTAWMLGGDVCACGQALCIWQRGFAGDESQLAIFGMAAVFEAIRQ